MAKLEYKVYICDRCGTEIFDSRHWLIGHHKYIHIFKWFMPTICKYQILYLCPDCYKSFREWAFLPEEE